MAPTSPADHRYTLPAEAGYVGQVGAPNGIAALFGQRPAGGFAIALGSSGASPYQGFRPTVSGTYGISTTLPVVNRFSNTRCASPACSNG
jgi:hypothetical protein